MHHARQNCMTEWAFRSGKAYDDPGNEVELDVLVVGPDEREWRVPAFWAGEQSWRVRFAPPVVGTYRYRSICSDESNPDLHGVEGLLEVSPYDGDNALLGRGPLRVAADARHLEHRDGSPFFWLADTWWMGLCRRLAWPEEFRELLADRVGKGFTVIQIVAGLYPDMGWPDERGANEAGHPWEEDFSRLRPAYFDMADLRIAALVTAGLVPCIVGCWGYYLSWMGVEGMKRHWRNLVARWAAYPVVWCLAGEATMPYYLSEDTEGEEQRQKQGWTELAAYVRAIDPYHHPITIHPGGSGRDQVEDPRLLDFEMLQTGHGGHLSIANTLDMVAQSYQAEPRMPMINSEVSYEGIMETCREEIQRFMFWVCMLSGAAGHTYGANGIWQVNEPGRPFGPSPHGFSYGDRPWNEAYRLPGSAQLGLAKRLLERYQWWRFEPHPEWVEPHGRAGLGWPEEDYTNPYAAGIPGEVYVIFLPVLQRSLTVHLEPGPQYRAYYWNPSDGSEIALGIVRGDEQGRWLAPAAPIFRDWVLVVERS